MSAPDDFPPIVQRAFDLSRRSGFASFCRTETGRLLAALAASRSGVLAEFGTGTGVGAAWLRSGLRPEARLLTAELDAGLAEKAAEVFAEDKQVEVIAADWSTLQHRGPFSLLFLDSRDLTGSSPDTVVGLLEEGGIVVLDDFEPSATWPPLTSAGRVDLVRQTWLSDDRFCAVEVMVAPDTAVIVASRR